MRVHRGYNEDTSTMMAPWGRVGVHRGYIEFTVRIQ